MKKKASIQYTIRSVPRALDQALRDKAMREHKSINDAALSVMERGLGISRDPIRYDDLDDLAGTWVRDPECDQAMEGMRKIDQDLWT
jgi:hypothetical protein